MTKTPRIRRLIPGGGPYKLILDWDNGARTPVDLAGVVARVAAFAPLKDPELFRSAEIIDYGIGIGWPGGLDFSADSLRIVAEEQAPMTTAEFTENLKALGVSNREAADLFDCSLSTIKNYRAGHAIPKAVVIACRAMRRDAAVFRAHFRPRSPGRPRKEIRP